MVAKEAHHDHPDYACQHGEYPAPAGKGSVSASESPDLDYCRQQEEEQASSGINMFYRQIILWRGLPFRPSLPASRPLSLEEMTREEFDAKMARGIAEAKAGEGIPADEFFASLREEILQSYV